MDIKNATFLISGGGSGLGAATARVLAKAGGNTVIMDVNAETGEQKIYRNGILWHSGTGLTRTMTGVTAFTLGSRTDHSAEFWNGSMDDFRLYNQELSQEEILWLAGITDAIHDPF